MRVHLFLCGELVIGDKNYPPPHFKSYSTKCFSGISLSTNVICRVIQNSIIELIILDLTAV
jgi:hypothetical protein